MSPKVWLITGCTSGFGAQFVHELLSRGEKVIASARNSSRLLPLQQKGAAIIELDVTSPQSVIDAAIQEAISIYGYIDVLINNAGNIVGGFCEEITQEQYTAQLATNLFGPISVTRALLPHFRSRRTGRIAFTSSIYSWYSTPGCSPYAVSKHGLAAYAETLCKEVKGFGIEVVGFDIGHFRTSVVSLERARFEMGEIADYEGLRGEFLELVRGVDGHQPGDPVKGVRAMVDVLVGEKMPLRVPVGKDAAEIIRGVCEGMLGTIKEWEGVTCDMDLEGPKEGLWALGGGKGERM